MRRQVWRPRSAVRPSPAGSSRRPDRAPRPAVRSEAPREESPRCTFEHFRQRDRARRRYVLRGDFDAGSLQLPELTLFVRRQKNVAKLLGSSRAVMDATKVDVTDRFHTLDEPVHAADVAGKNKSRSRIDGVFRMIANGGTNIYEANLHVRRNRHPIELFLPVARCHEIIDENEETDVEWLAPPDDDLTVDQAVINAVEVDTHQRPTTISDAFPRTAVERAASVGDTSVLKTKSRSVARLTPLTSTSSGLSLTIRLAAMVALPAGRSVKITRAPVRAR